jgi:glycosyltransferase involved in cell wall biosynthesis
VSNPKYSIILPVYNGLPYLETAITSVLSSRRNDFELIVSDDHSNDGSLQYLESIRDKRLRLFKTPSRLSMAEHWEWALSRSKGTWGMFLGQDDALQGYFFEHADSLTDAAVKRSLRIITARRSYIFWPGCEADFPQRFQYFALNTTYERRTDLDCFSSLFLGKKYHELPQMYTNSLFHMSLIEEARRLQEGRVFTCHPQDANLAAIAILLEKAYLRSEIPLGWVGTSPSSAGLAMAKSEVPVRKNEAPGNTELASDYAESILKSDICYPKFAGEFWLANESIYLWQALVVVSNQLDQSLNRKLKNKFFLSSLFASALAENFGTWRLGSRRQAFQDLVRINQVGQFGVWVMSVLFGVFFILQKFVRIIVRSVVSRGSSRGGLVAGFQTSANESSEIDVPLLNSSTTRLFGQMSKKK